jgi:ubiquinone/menaquinone biosynthesis C-methylase UbiE
MSISLENIAMRTKSVNSCYVCGKNGALIYSQLSDQLFSVSGKWNFKKCLNSQCGLLWLDPRPLEEDLWKAYVSYHTHASTDRPVTTIRRFWSLVQDAYIKKTLGYKTVSQKSWLNYLSSLVNLHPLGTEHFKSLAMFLEAPNLPGSKVLDVGCGNGEALERMKNMGWEVEGIDFDQGAVDNARTRGVKVRLGDLHSQKYADNYFDAIYMSHVIEHVVDPCSVFEECYRILKPEGKLVLLTPNNESLGHKFFKKYWRGLEHPRHIHIFNMRTLRIAINQTSFKFSEVRIKTSAKSAYYILWASSVQMQLEKIKVLGHNSINMGFKDKIIYLFIQALERGVISIKPESGEEILLIATKNKY